MLTKQDLRYRIFAGCPFIISFIISYGNFDAALSLSLILRQVGHILSVPFCQRKNAEFSNTAKKRRRKKKRSFRLHSSESFRSKWSFLVTPNCSTFLGQHLHLHQYPWDTNDIEYWQKEDIRSRSTHYSKIRFINQFQIYFSSAFLSKFGSIQNKYHKRYHYK